MSGGTRCNVLPHESKWPLLHNNNHDKLSDELKNRRFFTTQPDLLADILGTWSIQDQKHFFEKDLGVELALEYESGKYFPESNDSKEILDAFLKKIYSNKQSAGGRTQILTNTNVDALEKIYDPETEQYSWKVKCSSSTDTSSSSIIHCDKIVIASGGISVINKEGTGLQLLSQMGHRMIPLYPALTPLLSSDELRPIHKGLAGISVEKVKISAVWLNNNNEQQHTELIHQINESQGFLFTHRGYSGPSVLNISHSTMLIDELQERLLNADNSSSIFEMSDPNAIDRLMYHPHSNETNRILSLEINWTPDISREEWISKLHYAKKSGTKTQLLKNFLHKTTSTNIPSNMLPSRLIQLLFEDLGDLTIAQISPSQIEMIVNRLIHYRIPITKNEGLKKAEVTGGGVDLRDISTKTLESLVQPNMFIIGEALDAFGCIGGFNFAMAWITGRLAGTAVANSFRYE
jgi:predicted flavoprotein YhiN